MTIKFVKLIFGVVVVGLSPLAAASVIPADGWIDDGTWNGWTEFGDDDGHVGPGGGSQAFDAEFLFYKMSQDGKSLSIGLQTGFDVEDGHQTYGGKNYWAGDLFLSFDDNTDNYEYAIDFGFDGTCGYSSRNVSTCGDDLEDDAGIYSVSEVNNDIYFQSSGPFAMQAHLP